MRYLFAILGEMAVEGDVVTWVARPPEAPSVLGPTKATRTARTRDAATASASRSRGSGTPTAAGSLPRRAARRPGALRAGPARPTAGCGSSPKLFAAAGPRRRCSCPPSSAGRCIGGWYGFLAGLIWGGAVRIFLLHHVTFSINSICHFVGPAPIRIRRRVAQRRGGCRGSRSASPGTTTTTPSRHRPSTGSVAWSSTRAVSPSSPSRRRGSPGGSSGSTRSAKGESSYERCEARRQRRLDAAVSRRPPGARS